MNRRLELTLSARAASVRRARSAVGAIAADLGARPRVVDDVRLCVSEATTNVVRHAYGWPPGDVRVVVDDEGGELVVRVEDDGFGLSEPRNRADPGGYGLRIIKTLSDQCRFSSTPRMGTRVEMVFTLNGNGGGAQARLAG
jgi:anti-sigma regulatory factor (Ser/Thr protein kinase)